MVKKGHETAYYSVVRPVQPISGFCTIPLIKPRNSDYEFINTFCIGTKIIYNLCYLMALKHSLTQGGPLVRLHKTIQHLNK